MAVPEPFKLDWLIQETEALKFEFEYAIQRENLKAFFQAQYFELSPREKHVMPVFSTFDRKIKFFQLIADCIAEVNENVSRFIETDEHVKRYLNGVLIKIEHAHRKISCFVLGNLTENEINVCLGDENTKSLFESMAYIDRINLPKDPNAQIPAEREFTGSNSHSGTLVSNLHLTINYVFTCNHIEVQFERLRRFVNEQVEIYNPASNQKKTNNIQSSQNGLESNKINSIRTFKSIFIQPEQFDKLVSFMIKEGQLSKSDNDIIWKGFRPNAKYEVSAFHEALYEAKLLKYKASNDTDLITLASNTFYEFKAVDRTMRNKATGDAIIKYRELISRFKLTLG